MNIGDVWWAASIIARGAVHCVSDETVKALAKRVLELEAQVAARLNAKDMVRARVMEEREACAKLCDAMAERVAGGQGVADALAVSIRARGSRSTPTLDDVKRGGA